MKNTLIIAVALALLAGSALADITYAPFLIGGALDASGNPIANGTYVMVLDLNGDGWQGNSYTAQAPSASNNASTWAWDSNDLVMDIGSITDGEAYPSKMLISSQIPATYTANVDHYYILWFDTPFSDVAAGPGKNIHYGAEDLGTVGTDPGNYSVFPDGGNASLVTVPEPATVVVLLVGGLMGLRRRMGKSA